MLTYTGRTSACHIKQTKKHHKQNDTRERERVCVCVCVLRMKEQLTINFCCDAHAMFLRAFMTTGCSLMSARASAKGIAGFAARTTAVGTTRCPAAAAATAARLCALMGALAI